MDRIIFKEEAYRIMGACFEVFNHQGPGFLEAVYQECLQLEFSERSIPFAAQTPVVLKYKGSTLRHIYVPDFVCFGKIIIEIKAVSTIANEHRAQTIHYLKATGFQLGILINFGNPEKLEYQRFVNR